VVCLGSPRASCSGISPHFYRYSSGVGINGFAHLCLVLFGRTNSGRAQDILFQAHSSPHHAIKLSYYLARLWVMARSGSQLLDTSLNTSPVSVAASQDMSGGRGGIIRHIPISNPAHHRLVSPWPWHKSRVDSHENYEHGGKVASRSLEAG